MNSAALMRDTHRVRAAFSRAAPAYDNHASVQRLAAKQAATLLQHAVPTPSGIIMDAGAGTGFIREALPASYHQHLLECDIAMPMCRQLATKHTNAMPVAANMCALPVADRQCQAVVSSLAVQWLIRPQAFFKEARRLLAPEGILVIATLGPNTLMELRDSFRRAGSSGTHTLPLPKINELSQALEQAGFAVQQQSIDRHIAYHHTVGDVLNSVRRIGAGNKSPGRGMASRQLFQEMENHYVQRYASEQGLPASWELYYLVAQKTQTI